jgi:hypothetical protein
MLVRGEELHATISALMQAWEILRGGEAGLALPENVILLPLTELRGRPKSVRLGHFAPSRWVSRPNGVHQVALHPGLFDSAEDLLLVLLHEAAHGILLKEQFGCSQDGYYHRKEFRNQCLMMDLHCQFSDTRYGWNHTRWPESGVPAQYEEALEFLRAHLKLAASVQVRVPDTEGNALPISGRVRLSCQCDRPRAIYVARSIAAGGGIRCERCGANFQENINPQSDTSGHKIEKADEA